MGGLCFQVLGSLGVVGVLGVFVFKTPGGMHCSCNTMLLVISLQNWCFVSSL